MGKASTFRVGERVVTSRGFVAEIVHFAEGLARIRYLGNHFHLGEMEIPVELLRLVTPGDLLLAGIEPEPEPSRISPEPTHTEAGRWQRRRPHGDNHAAWRSIRDRKQPTRNIEANCKKAIAAFMAMHKERNEGPD